MSSPRKELLKVVNEEFLSPLGRAPEASINWLIQYSLEHPECISLAAGLVDPDSFQNEILEKYSSEVLKNEESWRLCLQYGVTQGEPNFREAIVDHLNSYEQLAIDSSHVLIGNGSQQVLYLLSQVLINQGDIVLVETPSYYVFMDALKQFGARIIEVPCDDEGMVPAALEKIIGALGDEERNKIKLIYTITYCQNPTGRSYSQQRREELWDLYLKLFPVEGTFLVEDAAYRELNFEKDGGSFLVLKDSAKRLIYTGTFSKAVAPGLRLGYGVVPKELLSRMVNLKGSQDFGSNHIGQHAVLNLMSSKDWEPLLVRVKDHYHDKAMLTEQALKKEMPQVKYTRPKGGLYYWLELPEGISSHKEDVFFKKCIEEKVLYVPGSFFFESGSGKGNQFLRITYAFQPMDLVCEGIQRMGNVLKEIMESSNQ